MFELQTISLHCVRSMYSTCCRNGLLFLRMLLCIISQTPLTGSVGLQSKNVSIMFRSNTDSKIPDFGEKKYDNDTYIVNDTRKLVTAGRWHCHKLYRISNRPVCGSPGRAGDWTRVTSRVLTAQCWLLTTSDPNMWRHCTIRTVSCLPIRWRNHTGL